MGVKSKVFCYSIKWLWLGSQGISRYFQVKWLLVNLVNTPFFIPEAFYQCLTIFSSDQNFLRVSILSIFFPKFKDLGGGKWTFFAVILTLIYYFSPYYLAFSMGSSFSQVLVVAKLWLVEVSQFSPFYGL